MYEYDQNISTSSSFFCWFRVFWIQIWMPIFAGFLLQEAFSPRPCCCQRWMWPDLIFQS